MYKILVIGISLIFAGCSHITTLRTKEIKAVESNLQQKVDSLELKLDSMITFQQRQLKLMRSEIKIVLDQLSKNEESIAVKLEETQYQLKQIKKQTKENSQIIKPGEQDVKTQAQNFVNPVDLEMETLYAQAKMDYNQGKYKKAFQGFKTVYSNKDNKNQTLIENSLFWMASCYEATNQLEKSVKVFERLLKEFVNGAKYCTANLKLASLHDLLNDKTKSKEYLNEITSAQVCQGTNEEYRARELLKE